jgi:nucleotide-binding universal stress UspA family protein
MTTGTPESGRIDVVAAAVDGSEPALAAVDLAADEAVRRQVGLLLVHASARERYEQGIPDDDFGSGFGDSYGDSDSDSDGHGDSDGFGDSYGGGDPVSERKVVEELLAQAVERVRARYPQLSPQTRVLPEQPVRALLGLRGLAPLLVLGSRGRGGFQRMLLGSVSLRVAALADFPVLVVRATAAVPEARRRLVVGVGPSRSPALTEFAVGEAVLRQADLDLVHVWRSGADAARAFALMDTTVEHVHRLLSTAPPWVRQGATVRVLRRSLPGDPAPVLLRQAAGADLLIVGAHHGRGPEPGLGTVNHALLHQAPCPVAVVPDPRTA